MEDDENVPLLRRQPSPQVVSRIIRVCFILRNWKLLTILKISVILLFSGICQITTKQSGLHVLKKIAQTCCGYMRL